MRPSLLKFVLGGSLPFLSIAMPAGAAPISGVTVYNGFPAYMAAPFSPAAGGYPANDAVDGDLSTDYASNGGGTSTFLDFDLGIQQPIGQIVLTDRTSSGGGNGSHAHGTSEFNTAYNLVFSNDSTFASGTTTIAETATAPVSPAAGAAGDAAFSTTYAIPGINARYIRVQVTAGNGNNGLAEAQFSTTPEPGSLGLFAVGVWGCLTARATRKLIFR